MMYIFTYKKIVDNLILLTEYVNRMLTSDLNDFFEGGLFSWWVFIVKMRSVICMIINTKRASKLSATSNEGFTDQASNHNEKIKN